MHFGVRVLILMSSCFGGTVLANEQPLEWRLEPFAVNCSEVQPTSSAMGEGDYVQHRCQNQFGPPLWLLYQEGVRLSVGFGERPHFSLLHANASRPDWPIQWGGTTGNGRYGAEFAVVRFTVYGDEAKQQDLVIFRLNSDGTSCVVGIVRPQVKQNEKAQVLAEANRGSHGQCKQPIVVPD